MAAHRPSRRHDPAAPDDHHHHHSIPLQSYGNGGGGGGPRSPPRSFHQHLDLAAREVLLAAKSGHTPATASAPPPPPPADRWRRDGTTTAASSSARRLHSLPIAANAIASTSASKSMNRSASDGGGMGHARAPPPPPPPPPPPARTLNTLGSIVSSSQCHMVSLPSSFQGGGVGEHHVMYAKRRSAIGLITGIFTCWSKTKESVVGTTSLPRLSGLGAAALLEQAKAQQEALMESQDTSDMWEWLMEQQQAVATQEHEMVERMSAMAIDSADVKALPPPPLPLKSGKQMNRNGEGEEEEEESWKSASPRVSPSPAPPMMMMMQASSSEGSERRLAMMFGAALLRCRWEINIFCRVYMQQIVRAGYSLINTLMEMEPSTIFLRRVHASYALEARINAALFRCFENDSFDDSGLTHIFDAAARAAARLQEYARMKAVEPAEALRAQSATYEAAFHAYAAAKSEEVLALLPEAALAFRSAAQRDRFMDAFLRAAKWAFLLHRLAAASNPPATIVRVGRGQAVDPLYVEPVAVPPIGSCARCSVTAIPTVEFMVMPGFVSHAHRKVFRCRVYQHFMCKRPPPP